MRLIRVVLLITSFLFLMYLPVFAQAGAREVSRVETSDRDIEKEKLLIEKIEKQKAKTEIKEEPPIETPTPASDQKVLVTNINVLGATVVTPEEIAPIISPFKNQEITIKQMQQMADKITDIYRKRGFVTSRAYLPPQKIESGQLEIRVVEGITGNIEVKGNRWFKSALLRDKIKLEKGKIFDYEILRRGLSKINEQTDRYAKAVIAPGKEPGTTDIILNVKDKFPVHVGFDWDNYGSRYIEKQRYKATLKHNNLLGFDDIFTFQYQLSTDKKDYRFTSFRYLFPALDNLKVGIFGASSKLKLGKEYEDLNARGKSKFASAYGTYSLIDRENFDLVINSGFDYKDIYNFENGSESSRDRLRIAKIGFDLDVFDKFGRTILTEETGFGIPGMWGGLLKVDPHCSRTGAGGKLVKSTINFIRLQKMPFDSMILWKNQMQISPYILPAAEQFQIGGFSNVRAYPPAEIVGDTGYSMTWEWSFPLYFIPRKLMIPKTQLKIYDTIKFVGFYDWANARLRRTDGARKNNTLRGYGCGLRLNVPNYFNAKIEFAWPNDKLPSDRKHMHLLAEGSLQF